VLDERTAALTYLLGDPCLLYVAVEDEVHVFELGSDEATVTAQISELREAVLSDQPHYPHGHALYTTLIAPAESLLTGRDRLLLSLDGSLHGLPFGLLQPGTEAEDSEEYLVHRFRMQVVPSLAAIASTPDDRRDTTDTDLVAIGPGQQRASTAGDPEHEAVRIANVVANAMAGAGQEARTRLMRGRDVTPEAVERLLDEAGRAWMVHIAAEAVESPAHLPSLDVHRPMELLLADDHVWSSDALASLRLRADIVALSADAAALGALAAGEGVLSLARTFALAGARAICASVLPVLGESAVAFFESMYDELVRGATLDDAVRTAQLNLVDNGRRPLHWAGWAVYAGRHVSKSPTMRALAPPTTVEATAEAAHT
jgi:CHAT domain-containing protein